MKGTNVDSEWRLAQAFLSATGAGVFEVSVDISSGDTHCTCPTWLNAFNCKHSRYVRRRLNTNTGRYPVLVPHTLSEEQYALIEGDPDKWREFVVNHARIEVL